MRRRRTRASLDGRVLTAVKAVSPATRVRSAVTSLDGGEHTPTLTAPTAASVTTTSGGRQESRISRFLAGANTDGGGRLCAAAVCRGDVGAVLSLEGTVKLTKSSSIDPQDTGLEPAVNPPCWGSETAVSLNLTIPHGGADDPVPLRAHRRQPQRGPDQGPGAHRAPAQPGPDQGHAADLQ